MDGFVKVFFELDQDEDGYPPCAVESVWAEKVGEDRFKIDNIPFYIRDLSIGDVVYAPKTSDGYPLFQKLLKRSENSTVRVLLLDESYRWLLLETINKYGCEYEVGSPNILVAVNVPPTADIDGLLKKLFAEIDMGRVEVEESAKRYDI